MRRFNDKSDCSIEYNGKLKQTLKIYGKIRVLASLNIKSQHLLRVEQAIDQTNSAHIQNILESEAHSSGLFNRI